MCPRGEKNPVYSCVAAKTFGSVSNVLHRIQIISIGIPCAAGDGLKTHNHRASPYSVRKLHKVTYID